MGMDGFPRGGLLGEKIEEGGTDRWEYLHN